MQADSRDCIETVEGVCSKLAYCGGEALIRIHRIRKGTIVPWHSHESWQASILLEGRLRVETRSGSMIVEPGMVSVFRPGEEHKVEALEDSVVVDVNWPLTQGDREAADRLAGRGACG